MRLSLLGLGILAPTASLGQVVETVWVPTGDCSPNGGAGGSGAGDSQEHFGTATIAYTTTNSNGVVTTLTTTSTYPIIPTTGSPQSGPVTLETKLTTTNSRGSTIAVTSTYASITTAITTPPLPIETTATCPQDNNTYYVAGGYTYEIYCGFDFYGSDLPDLQTDNLADCLLACSNYTPEAGPYGAGGASCVAATWQSAGNNCYRKYGIYEVNNEDPGVASGRQVQFEPAVPPTTNISAEFGPGNAYTGTFATSTGAGTANTGTGGSNNGITTSSSATNGSPGTTTNSGAEPTYSNISPTCSDNNTYYVDRFGLQYDIRCGLNFDDADVALQAHADTFEGCIQYCSLLKDCAGVSFQDTDCYPIFTFRGYRPETAAEGTGLLTAIPTDGHNSGSITPDDLCAEGLDGQLYTDTFQCTWNILCDQTVGGTALEQTIQTNLEACINYCAFYDGCESVYFEGTGGSASSQANTSANCFPQSSIGAVSADTGFSAATLQGTCNVCSSVPYLCDGRCLHPPIVARQPVRLAMEIFG